MFWTRFAALCYSKGEAPNVVAANVGVKSTGTVSGWKKGAIPRDGVLSALAAYFEVPVSYFFETEKNENKPTENGELTETQREAMELIMKMSDEQLKVFVATLKAAMGE